MDAGWKLEAKVRRVGWRSWVRVQSMSIRDQRSEVRRNDPD